jgi:hypothetical protein
MSQIKEMPRESQPDAALRDAAPLASRHAELLARLRELLDERGRLQESLANVDREIDRVRHESAEIARGEAERLRESGEDCTFTVAVEQFVQGNAEPPAEVDRDDFARCARKVVLALRRHGDAPPNTEVQVRFQPRSGRVVAIGLKLGEDATERQLYRRFDLGMPPSSR